MYVLLVDLAPDASLLADGIRSAFGGGGSDSGGGGGFDGGGFDGGGDYSGDGGDMPWWMVLLIFIGFIGLSIWSAKQEKERRRRKRERELGLWGRFAKLVPGATERDVERRIGESIIELNRAWSAGDSEAMRSLLTPAYHAKIATILEAMRALERRNEVGEVVPDEVELIELEPPAGNTPVRFRTEIAYTAADTLRDADGTVLATNGSLVRETWSFELHGESWLLDDVQPATRDEDFVEPEIERFARTNGLHYSADFGRMLLPTHGMLFSEASLEKSDVNNHVIGHRRGQLVQFYTYVENPVGDPDRQIVVAQATLPKRHHDILVRRRSSTPWGGGDAAGGLVEHSFESMAFNEAWRVRSHPDDDIATFELLHPAFLERLTALPLHIGIEAVGRFLYVFDEGGDAPYDVMLELLDEAFDELRM